ncbi:HEAT repeat domain-containing protein [Pendulispora albinea]|uniref:HEAT repeat domain-containing protein n=1 Tax=Pendulispora albinea TaxID=2741071 RepID=A0ABZ2LVM4_9BACT
MAQSVGHFEKVRALAATARHLMIGGHRAVTGSVITVYDHVSDKLDYEIAVASHVNALALVPNGKSASETLIAGCADGFVRLYNVKAGRSSEAKGALLREIPAHTGACHALAVRGNAIATAGADGALRVFALDGTKKGEWQLASRPLRSVAMAPEADGTLAAGGEDGVVRVLREGDPTLTLSGHDGAVTCLLFTPADGRLVSGGDDGTVRIWYLAGDAESEVRSKDDSLHVGGTTALLFAPAKSPDDEGERLISAGADGKLRVWRMSERRKPRTLNAGSEAARALAFAPKARENSLGTLFAAGDARTIFGYAFDAEGQPTENRALWAHGFDVLGEALKGKAVAVREKAALALAALEEKEALALVVGALEKDPEAALRARIAAELAAKGRTAAKKAIRARLDDQAKDVRAAALSALRLLEADAPLAPLRSALESRFPDTRCAALELLPPLFETSPLVAGLIASRLADEDAQVRRSALVALIATYPQGSLAALRAGFERGRADVRADALVRGAIAGLSNAAEFTPMVGKALDDEDADVRRIAFVLTVLARPALAAWLEAKDEAFGRALLDVFRRAGELSGSAKETAIAEQRQRLLPAAKESPKATLAEADREPLCAALACRTPDTCLRGARGLALLGDMRALGALLTISREPDAALRREAAFALVALSDPRAKKRIAWMLNDSEPAVRDAALTCYGQLERDPLLVSEAALHASNEDVRVRGLDILVKEGRGKPAAETLLGDSIEDESPKVRSEAFRTLWAWHQESPLDPIDRALSARFPDLRLRAVQELTAFAKKTGEPLVAPSLERLAKTIADRDQGVASAAYDATLEIKGKGDADTILAGTSSTNAPLREKAAKNAAKAPVEKLRSALSRLLEDTESAVRIAAIESLDALLPSEHGALAIGLQSSHLDLRVRAAELLARRREESIIDPMQALLADKELLQRMPPGVIVPLRQRAATSLANLGVPRLLKYFATILVKDDDPIVREQAARGLSNASRRGEEGYLLDLLGHEELAVRSWAAEGLARLGDARALPVLTGTLRHEHPPIRVGAILSFAALGPEGYGGILQGLEDPSRHVQRIVLSVILARDLRAFRRDETPDLLTSALSSQRPEVRFTAARALELRIVAERYAAYLVEVLMPDRPDKAADMERWPGEEARAHLMMGLAEALAGERPEQRYAAAQALRLRDRPLDYFREVQRVVAPRSVKAPWVPDTHPVVPAPDPTVQKKGPLALLRRLFAGGDEKAAAERSSSQVPAEEQRRLRQLAFGAYIGLLRQASADDEAHRVRRDAIERIVGLYDEKEVSLSSATPALARALDDPNHLVRQAAFAALRKVYADDTPLSLALSSSSADVVKAALDEWAARGEPAKAHIAAALDSRVPAARKYAFELLEKLSPKGSLEPLLAALSSEHADIRIGVLERLSTSQDTRVAAALVKALESDQDDLRLRAAELLATRRDDRAVDALAPWLRAEDPAVAQRARDALVHLGSPAAVRALMTRLEDGATGDERSILAATIGKVRGQGAQAAIGALSKLFLDEAENVRLVAFAGAISIVGPREDAYRERTEPKPKPRDTALTKQFLGAAVQSPFADIRALGAGELDELGDGVADTWLSGLFADRDRGVRTAAVSAYAWRVQTKNAPEAPLEDVLRGGARETMLAAAEALAFKKVAAALRPLLLFSRAGGDGERERALLALGTLGDKRALEELETIAAGGTEDAPAELSMQTAALEALGRMAPKLDEADRERVRDTVESHVGEKRREMSVAAIKALRWVGGERSRARIEAVLRERGSSDHEKEVAAKALGELGDVQAEATLARALDDDDACWAARDALEKLFPNDRLRVEFLAVESENSDISDPAAAYLADEGDAERLLAKLAKLSNESLRLRIRFGLARRAQIAPDAVIALLGDPSPLAREGAAWVAGARARAKMLEGPAKGALASALAAAAVRAGQLFAEAARAGKEQERIAELGAWVRCLWAARLLDPQTVRPHARTWLLETASLSAPTSPKASLPVEIRTEAARALRGGNADDAAALVKALSDRDITVRSAAASALSGAKDVLAIRVSPHDPVRLGLAARGAAPPKNALATAGGRRVLLPTALGPRRKETGELEQLRELARHDGAEQLHAIAALGRAATSDAIETLQKLAFKGGTEPVRKAAYRSLRRAKRIAAKEAAS